MKIMDFLSKEAISVDLKSKDKDGVINELTSLLVEAGEIDKKQRNKVIETLLSRESLGSTGIGQGIGIPHGKSESVKQLVASFGISQKGVDFNSLDGEPTYIFFLLVAPQDSAGPHLKALAKISRLLKDKYLRESLRQCKDPKDIIRIISSEDEKKV